MGTWLSACQEEAILLQIGVCVFLSPGEANTLLGCPRVRDSEELLISLTFAEVLLGGAPNGGLGLFWHRGGGGCGRIRSDVVFKACSVSSETLCAAGILGEKNHNGK